MSDGRTKPDRQEGGALRPAERVQGIGAAGIEKVYEVKLTAEERAALHKSAEAVRELVNVIKV